VVGSPSLYETGFLSKEPDFFIESRFGATEENLIPFFQDWFSINKSYRVQDRFEDKSKEFELLSWTPKRADLKPIENVWAEMVRWC
jgi:hypothetical protein